jgi:hypothetical protein
MIAAAVALALAAAQAPDLHGLDMEGWDVAQRAGGWATLTHLALGDQIPGFPQAWVRTEHLGTAPAASTLQRVEFDCATRRMRFVESYRYASRNLDGDKRPLPFGAKGWRAWQGGIWPRLFVAACDQ